MAIQLKITTRKTCRKLTWFGWLLLILFLVLAYRIFLGDICEYLSVNEPVKAETMIIEGWVDNLALKDALNYYQKHHFKHLVVTGQPVTQWHDYVKFKNTAEGATAILRSYGFKDSIYQAVIPRTVYIDRTYNTAIASRIVFEQHPQWEHCFDIFSVGVHARRTRLMFKRAFGNEYRIGILADVDRTFDPAHWWRSSKGFRNVSNEFVAFTYVWLFFHPEYKWYKKRLQEGFYIDSLEVERKQKDLEVADTARSPLDKASVRHFSGLHYFPVDINYRVKAKFVVDTGGAVFEMKTNTSRKPKYRVYAHLSFRINDTLARLTAYQNMAFLNDTVWGHYLFIPFRDKTCGHESYGAGRYLDLSIPEGTDSVWLDFNKSYNPYCAYADRWSCPLVPFENWLDVNIRAGEKKYRDHHE